MPSYPHQWLYLNDSEGCAQELINGARLARNLASASLCHSVSDILTNAGCDGYLYQPTAPAALNDPVFWIDAADGLPGRQYAPNRGSGGALLNAIYGADTSVGTDEPLWLGGAEKYLYTPNVVGNYATVPNTASLRITGDIEIVMRVAADDWTPAAVQTLISKYTAAADGYEVFLNTAGTLAFIARLSASDVTATSTVAISTVVADGSPIWLKIQRVSATGVVSFWYGAGNTTAPIYWSLLGATVAATSGAMTAGNTALRIGERPAGSQTAAAKFYRTIIRNTIDPSTPANVLDVDFTANTSQSSFVATAGGTLTISRSAAGRKSVAYQGRPVWLFGTDDFMTVKDYGILDFAANESFTLMAVVREHATPTSNGRIVSKRSTNTGYELFNSTTTQAASFLVGDGTLTPTATSAAATAGALRVFTGVRNVTTDTVISYLDGAAVSTADTTTATSVNAADLLIGKASGGTVQDFELVAVMLWRRALTATEVGTLATFYASSTFVSGLTWTAVDFTLNPWYNDNNPASSEALGFLIEEFTGLDGANHSRSSTPSGMNSGGTYYGPLTHTGRTHKLNVLLHGTSERGLTYLFRWLEDQLMNCCDSACGSQTAWIRQWCPSAPETTPQDGVARLERVVLAEGPTWEAEPLKDGGCTLRRVSFTLTSGDPCLYTDKTPLAANVSTTSGVTTSALATNPATFNGDRRQTRAAFSGPLSGIGTKAPVVTIYSPAEYSSGRKGLPVMRIAGYVDPGNTGVPTLATQIGEFILEGYESSGFEIVIDMAQRRVLMRPAGTLRWQDGSRLIGRALHPGMTRWFSFGPCDTGFVTVEPALQGLGTARTPVTSLQVSSWTTIIESRDRFGCC